MGVGNKKQCTSHQSYCWILLKGVFICLKKCKTFLKVYLNWNADIRGSRIVFNHSTYPERGIKSRVKINNTFLFDHNVMSGDLGTFCRDEMFVLTVANSTKEVNFLWISRFWLVVRFKNLKLVYLLLYIGIID